MPLARKKNTTYTYGAYLTWNDAERWELIEGIPYNMTPAPGRFHQDISRVIFTALSVYLENKKCSVYHAPFDVRLPSGQEADADIQTVVQPDIAVICDAKKLDDRGCKGAPDLVVEIISPHTVAKDIKEKFALYEKHGVKEYWIVYPLDKLVEVFKLGKDKQYQRPNMYTFTDDIRVGIFKNLTVSLKKLA